MRFHGTIPLLSCYSGLEAKRKAVHDCETSLCCFQGREVASFMPSYVNKDIQVRINLLLEVRFWVAK